LRRSLPACFHRPGGSIDRNAKTASGHLASTGTVRPVRVSAVDVRWLFWYPHTKLLDEKREDRSTRSKGALSLPHVLRRNASDEGSPFYATAVFPTATSRALGPHVSHRHDFESHKPRNLFEPEAAGERSGNLSADALLYCAAFGSQQRKRTAFVGTTFLRLGTARSISRQWLTASNWTGPRRSPFSIARPVRLFSNCLAKACSDCFLVEEDLLESLEGRHASDLLDIAAVERLMKASRPRRRRLLHRLVGAIPVGMKSLCRPGQIGAPADRWMNEPSSTGEDTAILGEITVDVYLNSRDFVSDIPLPVWEYALGGYKVLRKC